VAASGGRDSTALLHCTLRAAKALGLRVHALHVHHGLNAAADDWLRHLQRQCARWARAGWPLVLHVRRLAGAPAPGDSIEAWARRERYAALAEMARAIGCDAVLLGHHRRDQAETVLLQALRGSGPRGLAAMPAAVERAGLHWLRPWHDEPREAIEAYVARHRLTYVDDSSNVDERFARNRLRRRVWPALTAAFPEAEAALAQSAARAAQAAQALRELAQLDAAKGAVLDDDLHVAAWRALSDARRANLLRHQLEHWLGRGAPETLVVRLCTELPAAVSGSWPAPGGCLRLYRGRLAFERVGVAPAAEVLPATLDLHRPGRYPLPAGGGLLRVRRCTEGGIAPDRLRGVQARERAGGERFQLAPGAVPRSLKKQFQALGVPAWARHGPLLWAADGALLFVSGLGIDARARAPTGTAQLKLEWEPARVV
jgi:tRNA(Ile)-lysidine synthase